MAGAAAALADGAGARAEGAGARAEVCLLLAVGFFLLGAGGEAVALVKEARLEGRALPGAR